MGAIALCLGHRLRERAVIQKYHYHEVICDACFRRITVNLSRCNNAGYQYQWLRQAGWSIGKYVTCPDCRAKKKASKP